MNRVVGVLIVLPVVAILAGCVPVQHTTRVRHMPALADTAGHMTKQDVVSLAQAGLSDSLIVGMMDASHSYFQLTTQDVLDLKAAGVRESVIKAMLAQPPEDEEQSASDDVRYHVVPPYWYLGYYPYWGPWYSSSWYPYRYSWYRPVYVHRAYPMHFGGGGPGRRAGGGHYAGRRR